MLQDRDIVVMLQLRSKRVQEANSYQIFSTMITHNKVYPLPIS